MNNAWALLMATLNLFGLDTNPTCFLMSSMNISSEERTLERTNNQCITTLGIYLSSDAYSGDDDHKILSPLELLH